MGSTRMYDQSSMRADDAPMSADDVLTCADDMRAGADDMRMCADDMRAGADYMRTGADDMRMGADDMRIAADDMRVGADDMRTGADDIQPHNSVHSIDGTAVVGAEENTDDKSNIVTDESLSVRGVSKAKGKHQQAATPSFNCKGCRRVAGEPHAMCIRHLLENSLPVCTRKSRCAACANMDGAFWNRYMKSYYFNCQKLSDEDFAAHLEIQRRHGISADHRKRVSEAEFNTRRPDGTDRVLIGYTDVVLM